MALFIYFNYYYCYMQKRTEHLFYGIFEALLELLKERGHDPNFLQLFSYISCSYKRDKIEKKEEEKTTVKIHQLLYSTVCYCLGI